MLKKAIVTAGAGVLVVGFIFGGEAVSYLATGAGCLKDSVHDSLPTGFQIKRAKRLLAKIEPEVYKNQSLIVREEVELGKLAEKITKLENKQTKEEGTIKKMASDLESRNAFIHYAGHRYSREEVNVDLSNRFDRFRIRADEIKMLKDRLDHQQKVVKNARKKVNEMMSKRSKLLAEISKLEAHEKMLAVSKSASDIKIDDSQIAKLTHLLNDIKTDLEIESRMLDEHETFVAEINVDEPQHEELTDEIASYFSANGHDLEQDAATLLVVEPQIETSEL